MGHELRMCTSCPICGDHEGGRADGGFGTGEFVAAINALQFAEDTLDALAELVRVTAPGGLVAIANWAESDRSDLKTIDAALAEGPVRTSLPTATCAGPAGSRNCCATSVSTS
jgi:hypothetical protein